MTETRLSISAAGESLATFLNFHVPEGTEIDLTRELADQLTNSASNLVAMATSQGIDIETPRQAYEAVGWLCVQVESWLHNSPFEDYLLAAWAKTILG